MIGGMGGSKGETIRSLSGRKVTVDETLNEVRDRASLEVENDNPGDVCTGPMLDHSLYLPYGTSKLNACRECGQSSEQ